MIFTSLLIPYDILQLWNSPSVTKPALIACFLIYFGAPFLPRIGKTESSAEQGVGRKAIKSLLYCPEPETA